MYVVNRDGDRVEVRFDEITKRISTLCEGLDTEYVVPSIITQKVVRGMYPGVTTQELDELAAQTAAGCATMHPDFSKLAARIAVSNLHKNKDMELCFSKNVVKLYNHIHPETGKHAPLISKKVADIVAANAERLDAALQHKRDFDFDYFGFKTLEKAYLFRIHKQIAETPQQMYMRVALGIHMEDIDAVIESYDLMSTGYFTHATPTLFNAGTPKPQMSSCFLLTMAGDSIEGIYDTLKQCACISKYAGGIGLSIHNIRATDSYIAGTNGHSNGIVPMLRVFSNTARYVDQGGGKRKGSFAIYLEPWHADVYEFLDLKKPHGVEESRARDLFYALWVPDLFMKRVKADATWSLMCPNECPGLADAVGDEFEALYTKYEREGKFRKQVRALHLWWAILEAQIETGTPYMLYKDACNKKSNQQNLGVIKSSNLCTEIIEYTAPDEVAVCNLASIALPKFVNREEGTFDFERLVEVTKVVTRNLNKVVNINFYPIEEARRSNMRHRPIGIGVQGLADTFCLMRFPFDSPQAAQLNKDIFEALYFGAVTASCEVAAKYGPYETYPGSPASKGQLQFDLWGVTPSKRWDWDGLKADIAKHGIRNSLLMAPMPTASTAQILGNNEGIEPFTMNVYTRRTLAGEFAVVNKHMMKDLLDRGLWTKEVKNQLIADRGSIQRIKCIPADLKALYKTVWEIKQRVILDMAAARGPYICQSQSLNIHIEKPSRSILTSMHFYAWSKGLKTGMYYLRSRPKAAAIQFTVDQDALAASRAVKDESKTAEATVKGPMPAAPPVAPAAAAVTPMKPVAGAAAPVAVEAESTFISPYARSSINGGGVFSVFRPAGAPEEEEEEECLMCGS